MLFNLQEETNKVSYFLRNGRFVTSVNAMHEPFDIDTSMDLMKLTQHISQLHGNEKGCGYYGYNGMNIHCKMYDIPMAFYSVL